MPMSSGADQMGYEFGRRLRSFLEGGTWWDIIQLLKGEVPKNDLWAFIMAGIDTGAVADGKYHRADSTFAAAIDWSITRAEITAGGVEPYGYSAWWYLMGAGPLTIQGEVQVVRPDTEQPDRNQADTDKVNLAARNFVKSLVGGRYLASAPIGNVKPDLNSPSSFNGYKSWLREGTVTLKP